MRRIVGILGICVVTSVFWGNLFAEAPETKPDAKPEDAAATAEQPGPVIAEEIRQRLHEPITLRLDKVPLEDALVEILRKRHLDYWFDEQSIKEASIRLETIEVTCDLTNVSLRAALKRILIPAQLGWICDDAGIRITSNAMQATTCFPRIYDVGALLESPQVEVSTPNTPHQQAQLGGGAGPAASTPAETPKPQQPAGVLGGMIGGGGLALPKTPENILMHMIQGAVGGPPDAPWMEADGEGGSVHLIKTSHAKLLVVRQNELCHAELENLLNELISHQHTGGEEEAAAAPAEKNASRQIVRPRVRIVKQGQR